MSCDWINIRIAWYHIHCERGSLWRWKIEANPYWKADGKWTGDVFAVYDLDLTGWKKGTT